MRTLCFIIMFLISNATCWAQSPGTDHKAVVPQKMDAEGIEFFETRIRPVLIKHCYECHSANSESIKGGLLVDTAAGLLKGGESGEAISRQDPAASLLLESLRYESFEMPPAGKLPEEIINDFQAWLKMGAPDPRDEPASTSLAEKKIDFDKAREFWAFQPPEAHVTPSVDHKEWPESWIDNFILHRLETAKLSPMHDADRSTLLRRLAYDLTGLPPSEADLNSFLNAADEASAQASLETYVDRLLASPQFGEHWGRHWLDVVRYADSNGGDFNATFHNAWRFRNYIINSLNQDRPFDKLIVEHIAGDLLPYESAEQRERQLVATGFLMMGTKMLSERDKEKLRMDVVDEQVSTIGSAFLGMTMGCARCHDHKFDPIPTSDYYAMAGILKNTRTLDGEFQQYVSRWVRPALPIQPEHEQALKEHQEALKELKAKLKSAQASLKTLEDSSTRSSVLKQGIVIDDVSAIKVGFWKESALSKNFVGAGYIHDDRMDRGQKTVTFETVLPESGKYEVRISYTAANGRATNAPVTVIHNDGEDLFKIDQSKQAPIENLFKPLGIFEFTKGQPAKVIVSNAEANGYVIVDAVQFVSQADLKQKVKEDSTGKLAKIEEERQRVKQLESDIKALEKNAPEPAPLALAVAEVETCEDCSICIRGEHKNLGEKVPRGFLTIATYPTSTVIDPTSSGRLELAEWIADARHPLTARVYVNRVWQHLLGEGIVRSVDNFGHLGQRPSHPELLDQLAVEFIEHGWSTKWLVREIVLSHVYRLSSEFDEARWNADAENRLLWRANRKRLSAEAIRDTILYASGELDPDPGQAPMKGMGNLVTVNNVEDAGYQQKQTFMRTIYNPVVRNELPSLMRVFDFADPDFVSGRRPETTVPAQALWMLNGPFIRNKSETITHRLMQFPDTTVEDRVDSLFRLTLGRSPQAEELKLAVQFIMSETNEAALTDAASWTDLTHAILSSSAFRMLD